MDPLISTLSSLLGKLADVRSSDVLREHVSLLQTHLDIISKRFVELEAENRRLSERNNQLEMEARRQQSQQQFVEASGALFKPVAGGGYSKTPYCPACQSAMVGWMSFPYTCGNQRCKQEAGFTPDELASVMAELP